MMGAIIDETEAVISPSSIPSVQLKDNLKTSEDKTDFEE